MTMTKLLKAENVSKSFGATNSLRNASVSAAPGEITAIVGPSGSGKTTLLRLIAGMDLPNSGMITLGDRVLSDNAKLVPPESRSIGLVFQNFALFPHMTVQQNVAFGLSKADKTDRAEIVNRWIEKLSLSRRQDAYPHELSGGEQQRTALARALAPSPHAILLDEPFSGLDPGLRESVRAETLSTIRDADIPAILVTHDPKEVLTHADSVTVLYEGCSIQTGSPNEVYQSPNSLGAALALGAVCSLPSIDCPDVWTQSSTREDLLFRPEAVQINPTSDTKLAVERTDKRGGKTIICLKVGASALTCIAPLSTEAKIGEKLGVSLNRDLVFSFPNPILK